MELVINRAVWLRGEGSLSSCLLRPSDNKMCCIGIYLKAVGVPDQNLTALRTALEVSEQTKLPDQAQWLLTEERKEEERLEKEDTLELYVANDDEDANEDNRELTIKGLFACNGVNVTFVG